MAGTTFAQVASRSDTSVVARRSPTSASGAVISTTRTSVANSRSSRGRDLGRRQHRAVVVLVFVERVDHVLEALLHRLALHLLRRSEESVVDRELLLEQRELLRPLVAREVLQRRQQLALHQRLHLWARQ